MLRRLCLSVTMLLVMITFLVPSALAAESPEQAEKAAAATYPGTTITITAGDVLYSSKGWQTAFVGHVAIVGTDGKIYHSTPAVTSGGIGESVNNYFSRFTKGSSIEIYRYSSGTTVPNKAAKWAENNVGSITEYNIASGGDYNDITKNYCSKFLWQAYYFGGGVDLSFFPLDLNDDNTVAPNVITNSKKMTYKGAAIKN